MAKSTVHYVPSYQLFYQFFSQDNAPRTGFRQPRVVKNNIRVNNNLDNEFEYYQFCSELNFNVRHDSQIHQVQINTNSDNPLSHLMISFASCSKPNLGKSCKKNKLTPYLTNLPSNSNDFDVVNFHFKSIPTLLGKKAALTKESTYPPTPILAFCTSQPTKTSILHFWLFLLIDKQVFHLQQVGGYKTPVLAWHECFRVSRTR